MFIFITKKYPGFQAFLPVGGHGLHFRNHSYFTKRAYLFHIDTMTQNRISESFLPKITSTIVSVDALFLRFLPIFLYPKFTQTTQKNHPQSKKIKPFIELNPNHQFFIKLNTIKPPKISSSKLLKPLINQPFQQN